MSSEPLEGREYHTGILSSFLVQTIYLHFLTAPKGAMGITYKNQKDVRIKSMICFAASFQPKLNELYENLQNQQNFSKYIAWWVGRSWSSRLCWKTDEIIKDWRSWLLISKFLIFGFWFPISNSWFLISNFWFPIPDLFYSLMSWTKQII